MQIMSDKKMNIVFLVEKNYYLTKMSRIRFHTMRGIGEHEEVNLKMTGPGWEDYDNSLTCQENIDKLYGDAQPDMVVGFKPLSMNKFNEIKSPTCLRYNEAYDVKWTVDEILGSQANLVIFHHYNDYVEWSKKLNNSTPPYKMAFSWVAHSVDTNIFKPLPSAKKEYDVVILGATHVRTILGEHYPLRARMVDVLKKMPKKYKCATIPHVGGNHSDAHTDKYAIDFNNKLNSSKILVTCSGAPKSRFAKYLEGAAAGTAVAGDLYDDHPQDVEALKEFLIHIDMSMKDEQIIDVLVKHLEDEKLLENKIDKGLTYMTNFGVENYANRFVNTVKGFLAS